MRKKRSGKLFRCVNVELAVLECRIIGTMSNTVTRHSYLQENSSVLTALGGYIRSVCGATDKRVRSRSPMSPVETVPGVQMKFADFLQIEPSA